MDMDKREFVIGPDGKARHVDGPTIPSTSDDRTANNAMRHEYRRLSDMEKVQMGGFKDLGEAFIALIQSAEEGPAGPRREYSIAKTKVEEAVMWAVKGLTA